MKDSYVIYYQLGLMNETEYREFWISWENGNIRVGTGSIVNSGIFMSWTHTCAFGVRNIEISTGMDGSAVDWGLETPCKFNLSDGYH